MTRGPLQRFLMMEGADLARALCKQVEVDLRLVKGWQETATVCEAGLYFVRGTFDGKTRYAVVPHAASATLSPAEMQRWRDAIDAKRPAEMQHAAEKRDTLMVAVVERDGATSYFALDALKDTPVTLPQAYFV
jgi:hypothetical protein